MTKPLLKWADSNTKLIAPKMWQHAITMANVTRMRLSDAGYKEPDEGVLLGMLRGISQFAICNHFTNCYDDALELVMTRFREMISARSILHALMSATPWNFCLLYSREWEKRLTQRIVDYIDWGPRNLHLKNALLEDINDVSVYERSLHGVALGQARSYAIYDMMKKSNAFLTIKPHIGLHICKWTERS